MNVDAECKKIIGPSGVNTVFAPKNVKRFQLFSGSRFSQVDQVDLKMVCFRQFWLGLKFPSLFIEFPAKSQFSFRGIFHAI